MLALRELLIAVGLGMMLAALGILLYDLYQEVLYRRAKAAPAGEVIVPPRPQMRWRCSVALAVLAWAPLLTAFAIVVVPSGMAGVRVSQMSGTLPGTLYPGAHLLMPLVEDVALFDTRDQIFTTGAPEDGKAASASRQPRRSLWMCKRRKG